MMDTSLKRIWDQERIPVILRRTGKGEKLRVRLPFATSNRKWLQGIGASEPERNARDGFWELPKAWFNDFVEQALVKYGRLYVIQPVRDQEKCSPKCLNATGHECSCSCLGAYHGVGNGGSWFEVSETFATRYGPRRLACRLMVRKPGRFPPS